MNAQCGWATFSARRRHAFLDLLLEAVAHGSSHCTHVYTYNFVICEQSRKICCGLHGAIGILLRRSRLLCSHCRRAHSFLEFLRHLQLRTKRCKLPHRIIIRRSVQAYQEFRIRILLSD